MTLTDQIIKIIYNIRKEEELAAKNSDVIQPSKNLSQYVTPETLGIDQIALSKGLYDLYKANMFTGAIIARVDQKTPGNIPIILIQSARLSPKGLQYARRRFG